MKIYECCPYFDEKQVASIKIAESSRWVDEINICESDRTFKFKYKGYNFDSDSDKVNYHQLSGNHFKGPEHIGISRKFPFVRRKSSAWINEAIQRNYACSNIAPNDDDIIILSDIDEIIVSSN